MHPTASSRRSQADRRAQTRAALITAAVSCINTSGAAAVSTQQIAAAANLTRGAVQHHFGTPEALYLAVIDHGWTTLVDAHRRAPGPEVPLPDRLSTWAAIMHDAYRHDTTRAAYELLVAHRSNPAFLDSQLPILKTAEQTLDDLWTTALADTGHHTATLIKLRTLVRSCILGTIVRQAVDPTDNTATVHDLHQLMLTQITGQS
ncbi:MULTISPECIES: TetR/AcrR family transcriptional regulator [Streptomyces]|uniref:TetR/AcrR family transcriptional regulator n=1 Tax=Streptomyces TaxID=1883 RepID=UPI0029BD3C13|nr:TetR/AcrR family transcriptional regulator [Streptomyces europaeiscabiei]MDX3715765.1 TetR/AcrR family transcriptional regulator [Streptomyces europaeiscabiei]WSG19995.1 TetR/AcrR family transcriptional regulator [Streptomyces europaeiscabiei]